MTYLFILLKTSIYNLANRSSQFFMYRQMSGWCFLLSQVKVIYSLSGLGIKGAKLDFATSNSDNFISGGQPSYILKTILGLFKV